MRSSCTSQKYREKCKRVQGNSTTLRRIWVEIKSSCFFILSNGFVSPLFFLHSSANTVTLLLSTDRITQKKNPPDTHKRAHEKIIIWYVITKFIWVTTSRSIGRVGFSICVCVCVCFSFWKSVVRYYIRFPQFGLSTLLRLSKLRKGAFSKITLYLSKKKKSH